MAATDRSPFAFFLQDGFTYAKNLNKFPPEIHGFIGQYLCDADLLSYAFTSKNLRNGASTLLLKRFVDLDEPKCDPGLLSWACYHGNPAMVKFLLDEAKMNPNIGLVQIDLSRDFESEISGYGSSIRLTADDESHGPYLLCRSTCEERTCRFAHMHRAGRCDCFDDNDDDDDDDSIDGYDDNDDDDDDDDDDEQQRCRCGDSEGKAAVPVRMGKLPRESFMQRGYPRMFWENRDGVPKTRLFWPLHIAAWRGHTHAARELVEHGAGLSVPSCQFPGTRMPMFLNLPHWPFKDQAPDSMGMHGFTPLFLALAGLHVDVIKYLMRGRMPSPNQNTESARGRFRGTRALCVAPSGCREVNLILVAAMQSVHGDAVLRLVVEKAYISKKKLELAVNPPEDPMCVPSSDRIVTPIMGAYLTGNWDALAYLVRDLGADIDQDANGYYGGGYTLFVHALLFLRFADAWRLVREFGASVDGKVGVCLYKSHGHNTNAALCPPGLKLSRWRRWCLEEGLELLPGEILGRMKNKTFEKAIEADDVTEECRDFIVGLRGRL